MRLGSPAGRLAGPYPKLFPTGARRRSGNRSCVVVLLATSLTARGEGFWVLPVGTRRIGDPQPLVPRQLAHGEPLEVVHDKRRPPGLSPSLVHWWPCLAVGLIGTGVNGVPGGTQRLRRHHDGLANRRMCGRELPPAPYSC